MSLSFTPTYTQKRGPPVPSFDQYALRIKSEFDNLICRDPSEAEVQEFLEQNPSMVPGAWTPGSISGHGPFHNVLISQPTLHGFASRVPDFMWLSTHSGAWFPAMIEIERPSKKMFTVGDIPTAEFNQARHQIVQWKSWLDAPANVSNLMDHYGIPLDVRALRHMGLHFLLVYGRRSEFDGKPAISKARGHLLNGEGEELMSFDRLSPNRLLSDVVTVKALGNGRFKAIAVPETFSLSPFSTRQLAVVDELENAIYANPRISNERAEFLVERIAYWREWSDCKQIGVISQTFNE